MSPAHSVAFGSFKNWDLNEDGAIDARYIGDTNVAEVWHEESWVRVRHAKDRFQSRDKRADEGEGDYVFRDGKWVAR